MLLAEEVQIPLTADAVRHDHNFLGNWKGQYISAKGDTIVVSLYGSTMKGDTLRFVANGSSWEKQGHFKGYDKAMTGGVAQLSEGSETLTGKLEEAGIRWSNGELWRRISHDMPKGYIFKKQSELKGALRTPSPRPSTTASNSAQSVTPQIPPNAAASPQHVAARHAKKESGNRAHGKAGSQELR